MLYPQNGSMAIGSRRSSPTLPAAAAVFSLEMIEPRNVPCCQSRASFTSGTTRRAAAAEQDRADRHALRVLPLGRDHRALARGRGEARVRVRGRLALLRRPRLAEPVGELRGDLLGHLLPPDVAVGRERDVGEDRVLA